MRCRRGQHYETEEFMQMVSPTRTGSRRPPLRGPMHAFWKAGLVALGLAVIGTTGCSKNRSRDQDDDDDEDPAPAVNPSPASAQAASSWTFDSSTVGQPPAGFSFARTGSGRPGRWVVRAAADAPRGPMCSRRKTVIGQTTASLSP